MKTLKVLLQEVVSGIKAWVNSNFAQESNTVHKTGNEHIWGAKTFDSVIQTAGKICRYRPSDLDTCILNMETYEWVNTAEHRPDSFGVLLALNNQENVHNSPDAGWMTQIAFATSGNIYFRNKTNFSNPWNDWKTVFHNRQNAIPYETNTYYLGTFTNQWKSVYAQNYYYKGTQWGLDKSNVWTGWQTIQNTDAHPHLRLKRTDITLGDEIPESSKEIGSIGFAGSNDYNIGLINCVDDSSGSTFTRILARQKYDANGNRANDGTTYEARLELGVDASHNYYFTPNPNESIDLGDSNHKWKSINGLNPGVLSIPNMGGSAADIVDISSWYIQDPDDPDNPDAKIIDDSVEHTVSSDVPGWVQIIIPNVAGNFAYARQYAAGTNMCDCRVANGLADDIITSIFLVFPIIDNLQVRIRAKSAVVRIFPCLGNV